MVKKKANKPKQKGNLIPPESLTGYPKKKPATTPAEILLKTCGGGKGAS